MLVDASVSLKWFLDEPDAEIAESLSLTNELLAPELIASEVGNGLWKAVRKGALDREQALLAIGTLETRFDTFLPLVPVRDRALAIAFELEQPVYDCFYLAWAERQEVPLVTADIRLLSRVEGTPFADRCLRLSEVPA